MWFRSVWRGCGKFIEPLLIVLACYVFAGSPPPSVNEAHYLAKAKHYWQPDWCAGDFFLESADAHEVFFWTFGWITQFVDFPTAAWIGRVLVWLLFAVAWCRLMGSLTSQRWAGLLTAIVLLPLTYYGHLAGEWLIGGVEAKGFAYPLVFWALACVVEKRWRWVWPLLGLASSFHILVGGWAVVACLGVWWYRREEDNTRWTELLPWLVLGGMLSLPGLLPALQLSADATREQIQEANKIYTFRRLSHHLVPYRFAQWNPFAPGFTVLRPVSFAIACFLWFRVKDLPTQPGWQRFRLFVHASLGIAVAGLAIDLVSSPFDHFQIPPFNNLRASLLRYYWFRMSDMMVPVGIAAAVFAAWQDRPKTWWLGWAAMGLGAVGLALSSRQHGCFAESLSLQQQNWARVVADAPADRMDEDWLDICRWFRESTPAGVVVLTPVHQQTFKWHAHRPEVVTWKDVPQNAASLVAWWERRRNVYKLGNWPWNEPEQLEFVVQEYGITHIVWPDTASGVPGENAEQVYRNELFRVFAVRQSAAQSDSSVASPEPDAP